MFSLIMKAQDYDCDGDFDGEWACWGSDPDYGDWACAGDEDGWSCAGEGWSCWGEDEETYECEGIGLDMIMKAQDYDCEGDFDGEWACSGSDQDYECEGFELGKADEDCWWAEYGGMEGEVCCDGGECCVYFDDGGKECGPKSELPDEVVGGHFFKKSFF